MIIPVRCFTCGKVIEQKLEKMQDMYQILLEQQDIVVEECYYLKQILLMIQFYIVQRQDKDYNNNKQNDFQLSLLISILNEFDNITIRIETTNKYKYHFEIIAYQNKLLSWKKHLEKDINKVLQSTDIYQNAELGLFISNQSLLAVFQTIDKEKICEQILQKGKIKFSIQEQKNEQNRKLNEISNIIFQRLENPETGLPYPRNLIKNFIVQQIHFNLNNFPPSEQASTIIKIMRENGVQFKLSRVKVTICVQNENLIPEILQKIKFNDKIQILKNVGHLIFLMMENEDLGFVKGILNNLEVGYKIITG